MRSKYLEAIKTILSGWGLQLLISLGNFIIRTVFIYTLGKEYLGLNGLYSSILNILSLSELGIGSAITFYYYEPLREGNIKKIASIDCFIKGVYKIIGMAMFCLGVCVIPLLEYIVNFDTDLDINLNIVYMLVLCNTVLSYFLFSYRRTLLLADQREYINNIIDGILNIVAVIVKTVVLLVWADYYGFLIVNILFTALNNVFLAHVSNKIYPSITSEYSEKLSRSEIKGIFKKVYSIFITRVGATMIDLTDNIVISSMLGTIIVGVMGNYTLIISTVEKGIGQVVDSFRGAIGKALVKDNLDETLSQFNQMQFLMFFLGDVVSVCLLVLLNPFINIWLGEGYIWDARIIWLLVLHFFANNAMRTTYIYKECFGLFEPGRYIQIILGIGNLVISMVLARYLGVVGVLIPTVIQDYLFMIPIFSAIVFKKGFKVSPLTNILKIYVNIILIIVVYMCNWWIWKGYIPLKFSEWVIQAVVVCLTSFFMFSVIFCKNNYFLKLILTVKEKVVMRLLK